MHADRPSRTNYQTQRDQHMSDILSDILGDISPVKSTMKCMDFSREKYYEMYGFL